MASGFLVSCGLLSVLAGSLSAEAASVTLFGSLQSEVGCTSDFAVDCALTAMTRAPGDGIWRTTLDLPAGPYNYYATLDGHASAPVGAHGTTGGTGVALSLPASRPVSFYYDDASHWLTDNVTSVIASLAGSFQSELGCAADFDAGCLRTWLEDLDGDGIYTFAALLPRGSYSLKVVHDESFDENYGLGGIRDGANIDFATLGSSATRFSYDPETHLLDIDTDLPPPVAAVPLPATGTLLFAACCLVLTARAAPRRAARSGATITA